MREHREVLVRKEVSEYYDEVKLPGTMSFEEVLEAILEATGWDKADTIGKYRTQERIFRRGIIDLIATTNGCTLVDCARGTKRDYTTVIHSLHTIENRLDTDMYARRILREIMSYIKEKRELEISELPL